MSLPIVSIIINPVAGGAPPGDARARAELAASTVQTHGDSAEVFLTERVGHATELAKSSAERGARLVMAWGGDGTINEVACALKFGPIPMGIVPAGSGNGLARELGISLDPRRAIADALGAKPRTIDMGDVDGRYFANIAGIGLDAYVAAQFNHAANRRRGFRNYASIAGRALLTYPREHYRITIGEERIETDAVLVTVANSQQFGNGACIAPGAVVDDGRLDLVIVGERARWRTVCQLPRLFTKTVDRIAGCSIRRIDRATIECDRPMRFHVDGEPVEGGTLLRARVHPGALLVAARQG